MPTLHRARAIARFARTAAACLAASAFCILPRTATAGDVPGLRGRRLLAEAAAQQLDHRPGRRHHRRRPGTYLGASSARARSPTTKRAQRSIRRARNAASRRRRCWSSTPTAICCAPGAGPAKAMNGSAASTASRSTTAASSGSAATPTTTTPSSNSPSTASSSCQIGKIAPTKGSNDTTQLGKPAETAIDKDANEIYVADGYGNRRVIVFDATTGAYKRHWGAYGNTPNDDKQAAYDPKAPVAAAVRQSRALREDRQ